MGTDAVFGDRSDGDDIRRARLARGGAAANECTQPDSGEDSTRRGPSLSPVRGADSAATASYGDRMVFEIVLLIVVLLIGGCLLVQHFTRRSGAEPRATRPIVTVTKTGPDGRKQTGAIARSSSERVAEADERKRRAASRGSSRIVPAYLDKQLPRIDLRELPSSRFRIVGTAYWLRDDERARYGGQEYELVREPENEHDENAVAVYGRGRKVGHLSAAKAAALASDLDRLGPASFVVSGDTVSEASMKMWVDIPRVPGLRAFQKELPFTAR